MTLKWLSNCHYFILVFNITCVESLNFFRLDSHERVTATVRSTGTSTGSGCMEPLAYMRAARMESLARNAKNDERNYEVPKQ